MTNVAQNLHEKFVFYGKNAKEWMRKCVLLLPEINRLRIWEKKGFGSIHEYAAKLAGMSRNSVDEALRILRKVEDKPELRWVIDKKGINAIKPIVTIATQETADFWAEKAMEMSKNTLEVYVKEFKKAHVEEKNNKSEFLPRKEFYAVPQVQNISMELDPEIAKQLEKLKGQGNWNELMQKLLEAYKSQNEAKKPIPQENAKRYTSAKIKKYVLTKTNNTCAFPNCTKKYKYLHHADRFALTHEHNPDTLIPLCKAHERLAHAGLIENENMAPENWRIKTTADKASEKWQKVDKWVVKYYSGNFVGTEEVVEIT
ncbi:MAG: hypothetical protein US89_C0010G0020 [Candidatus Peregrinibacteria bacterium GW2011_GWF2_38_29]|nr:MAG: hypothetical protein US89_C0010G0020 [Candidatus Peregrinibacteria bacterium GW2011_GWF2_38_29]HBB02358.1 hypothetical protein [Candidatus Peregrinibacteria bacterium]